MAGVRDRLGRRAARAYSAGPDLSDALAACRRLAKQNLRSVVSFEWQPRDDPRLVRDVYVAAAAALGKEPLDAYLSIKASALDFSRELVLDVARRCHESGIRMHFDSLAPSVADHTLELATEALETGAEIGIALPGRWRRSVDDANWAVSNGVHVRVVKGQWSDLRGPEPEPREGFLRVIDSLAGRARHVAVATHDGVLARDALLRLRRRETPCEAELFLGLPVSASGRAAAAAQAPIRMYVTYGSAVRPPYSLRAARQDPRILGVVGADIVLGGHKPWFQLSRRRLYTRVADRVGLRRSGTARAEQV